VADATDRSVTGGSEHTFWANNGTSMISCLFTENVMKSWTSPLPHSDPPPLLTKHPDLIEAGSVLGEGVGADRDSGLPVGAGRGAQDTLVHPVHSGLGGALDHACTGATGADSLFDVSNHQGHHLGTGVKLEMKRDLVVTPCCQDDLHPRTCRRVADEQSGSRPRWMGVQSTSVLTPASPAS